MNRRLLMNHKLLIAGAVGIALVVAVVFVVTSLGGGGGGGVGY
jgi:hypothetical protein